MLTPFLTFSLCPFWEKSWSESCGSEMIAVWVSLGNWLVFPISFLFRRSLPLSAILPSIFSTLPGDTQVLLGCNPWDKVGMQSRDESKAHRFLQVSQKQPIQAILLLHWYSEFQFLCLGWLDCPWALPCDPCFSEPLLSFNQFKINLMVNSNAFLFLFLILFFFFGCWADRCNP